MALLEIKSISVFYNKIKAVDNLTLFVEKGELVTLIGANGAGKTTVLRAISGLIRPRNGSIIFKGIDITRMRPDKIVQLGIAHCPEERKLFPRMKVKENLMMGAFLRKEGVGKTLEWIYSLFPVLKERENQLAGSLSGGEQQMLAIGRALMSQPELLMFDEPSLGLAPNLVKKLASTIKNLNQQGLSVLLVEQNVEIAFSISNRGYI
ncbi:MAG: ABC transporter ATP-binding protein, partial [Spirochaetes bacterium]